MPPTAIKAPVAFSAADADELGELQRQIDLLDPVIARYKVLTERADDAAKASPKDEPVVYRGAYWELQLGPRRNERTVTEKWKAFVYLRKLLTYEGLVAVLDIPLGLIDKNVPDSISRPWIVKEQSGYRSRKLVALAPLAAELPVALAPLAAELLKAA
jgi:hypothetical protein